MPLDEVVVEISKGGASTMGNVTRVKYGKVNFWMTRGVNTTYGVCLWRSKKNLWPRLKDKLSLNVKDGRKTQLWEDNW